MRKLFTFVAAMCCTVFSVMAGTMSDGVFVRVGSAEMSDANHAFTSATANSDILSGSITYDVSTHTLTLDNAVVKGTHSSAELYVHAGSSGDFDVTIKLIGTNKITANMRGIWMYYINSSHKFIITGDKSASLSIETTYSAGLSPLVASEDNSSSPKYWDLEINGGCSVYLKAKGKVALIAKDLTLNRVNLTAEVMDGTGDVITFKGALNTTYCKRAESTSTKKVYKAPDEFYPIFIKGFQLNSDDRALNASSPRISTGSLEYDPATRTLTLDEVTIENVYNTEPAILINDEGGTTTINLKGANALNHRAVFQSPVVITGVGTGNQFIVDPPTGNNCIDVQNTSLAIKGGVSVFASGKSYGIIGTGAATLTVERSFVQSWITTNNYSPLCGFTEVKLLDCEFTNPTGANYDPTDKQLEDAGGNALVKVRMEISQTKYVFTALASPEGAGTISLKKGDEAISNPYIHESSAGSITATAAANTGWNFWKWSSGETDLSRDYFLSDYNEELAAYFLHDLQTSTMWNFANSSAEFYGTMDFETSSPYNNPHFYSNYQAADYYDGDLFYAIEGSSASVVYKSAFTTGMDAGIELIPESENYGPIYTMAPVYGGAKSGLYLLAKDNNVNNVKLLFMEPDGTHSVVGVAINGEDPAGAHAIASAVGLDGTLYVLRAYPSGTTMLYRVNTKNAEATLIGNTGIKVDPDTYANQIMNFDYNTGELLWYDGYASPSMLYIVDTETGAVAPAKEVTAVTNGQAFFSNASVTLRTVKVSVKNNRDELGSVALPSGEKEALFPMGSKVTITATPSEMGKFVKWHDGNTNPTREIVLGASNVNYVAEFAWADGITAYPIWIGGKQIHSKRLGMSNANNDKIASGTAIYDPEAKVLTLNALTMTSNANDTLILIGDASSLFKVNLKVENTVALTSTLNSHPLKLNKADVKIIGDGNLQLKAGSVGAYLSKGSTLTFEGVTATVQGSYGVRSAAVADNDKVAVRGSNLTIKGASIASYDVSSVTWAYCTTTPATAVFDNTDKRLKDGGSPIAQIVFAPQPILRGKAHQDGTGTVVMKLKDNTGEQFTDIGWFANGAEVNMTAKPASGFIFARWMDDTKWGDQAQKADWLPAQREITKTAAEQTYTALFYKQPAAVTWYGIHDGKFVQFKSREYGANVIESTSDASSITAGDNNGSRYYIADAGELKYFTFTGVTKDKDQVNFDKTTKVADYTGTIYDMAWDFSSSKLYIIKNDAKIYYLHNDQVDELASLVTGELKTPVTARALAIDGSGKKYILSNAGILYLVTKENTSDKEFTLTPVGDNGGDVGATVTNVPQSLAFDHVTGELIWAAADYMRIIDTKTAKSYIAGDLGQTKGAQGVIKGLQRRDQKVTVSVEVAAACKDMGTAVVGESAESVTTFKGVSVTITATPAEGYKFLYWQEKKEPDEEPAEPEKENPYSFGATSITYVAYFEKESQGIEDVNVDEIEGAQKLLINGNLYIIRDNRMYTVQGTLVK